MPAPAGVMGCRCHHRGRRCRRRAIRVSRLRIEFRAAMYAVHSMQVRRGVVAMSATRMQAPQTASYSPVLSKPAAYTGSSMACSVWSTAVIHTCELGIPRHCDAPQDRGTTDSGDVNGRIVGGLLGCFGRSDGYPVCGISVETSTAGEGRDGAK